MNGTQMDITSIGAKVDLWKDVKMIKKHNIQYDTGWGINMASSGKAEVLHYACATFNIRQCFVIMSLVKYLKKSINDISLAFKMKQDDIQHKTGWGINIRKSGKIEILHYALLTQRDEDVLFYPRSFRLYHDFSIKAAQKNNIDTAPLQDDANNIIHTEVEANNPKIITKIFRYIYSAFTITQWYITATIKEKVKHQGR
jgi:hypothetical protein